MAFKALFTSDKQEEAMSRERVARDGRGRSPSLPASCFPLPASCSTSLACHTTCSTWLLPAHTTSWVFPRKKMLSACPLPASFARVTTARISCEEMKKAKKLPPTAHQRRGRCRSETRDPAAPEATPPPSQLAPSVSSSTRCAIGKRICGLTSCLQTLYRLSGPSPAAAPSPRP